MKDVVIYAIDKKKGETRVLRSGKKKNNLLLDVKKKKLMCHGLVVPTHFGR